MTSYQEAYDKMSQTSESFLLANSAITATLPSFSSYFTLIQTTNTQLQATFVLQGANKSGSTTAKKQLRETMISQAIDISRRMIAYATNVNNSALLSLIDYNQSDLKKMSDQKAVSICQIIRDNANTNVTALAPYGITAAIITTLQTSITNFSAAIPKSRVNVTSTANSTKTIATLIKTLVATWSKIDKLVDMVTNNQPAFYNEYQNVRKVIVPKRVSLSLKVKTINAKTGAPEPNVTLILEPANEMMLKTAKFKNIVKKTAAGGGCNCKNIQDGSYKMKAIKPGFKVIENITVNIVNGELNNLDISMETE